jgi:hypothetical protein
LCCIKDNTARPWSSSTSLPENTVLRRALPPFSDLRGFLEYLETRGRLHRIRRPVSVVHDLTEIHRRVLREGGPALLIEQPIKSDGDASAMPMLVNLFGTVERIAWGLGITPDRLPALGETLAEMRNPTPPQSFSDAVGKLPLARAALSMRPRMVKSSPAQSEQDWHRDCAAVGRGAEDVAGGSAATRWNSRQHRRVPSLARR